MDGIVINMSSYNKDTQLFNAEIDYKNRFIKHSFHNDIDGVQISVICNVISITTTNNALGNAFQHSTCAMGAGCSFKNLCCDIFSRGDESFMN